ncbi:MAG TPA: hypothetical protein VN893_03695, partial [Bryobacteraceae bacterium]|nr:hypothetical protein [Bryobacteraceae bacterium]
MKKLFLFAVPALLMGANTLVVTASNTTQNQLMVYDTTAKSVQTISTHGQGGVSGNAGGIAAHGG